MEIIKGDLIQLALGGEFDVIVHGCNCFHTMGAGIAKTISQTLPEAFEADKETPYGDPDKLGSISTAHIQRNAINFTVVNAYTQFNWKGRGRKADYDAITKCFKQIASQFSPHRIGYPLIGAGLAGGDWAVIEKIIENELADIQHTLVMFDG